MSEASIDRAIAEACRQLFERDAAAAKSGRKDVDPDYPVDPFTANTIYLPIWSLVMLPLDSIFYGFLFEKGLNFPEINIFVILCESGRTEFRNGRTIPVETGLTLPDALGMLPFISLLRPELGLPCNPLRSGGGMTTKPTCGCHAISWQPDSSGGGS